MSTRLATGAQVKQFLGVCEWVSGELSSETGGLSNTGAPSVRVGLPRAGRPPPQGGRPSTVGGFPQGRWASPGRVGFPRAGPPPGRVGLVHLLRVWIEQKAEEGGVCPSAPAPALSWCHPLPCPRVLRPPDVG